MIYIKQYVTKFRYRYKKYSIYILLTLYNIYQITSRQIKEFISIQYLQYRNFLRVLSNQESFLSRSYLSSQRRISLYTYTTEYTIYIYIVLYTKLDNNTRVKVSNFRYINDLIYLRVSSYNTLRSIALNVQSV